MSNQSPRKRTSFKRAAQTQIGVNRHSTILNISEFSSAPVSLRCCATPGCCDNKVHCPYCDVRQYKPTQPSRVKDHLYLTHFQHAVYYLDFMIVKCFRACRGSDIKGGHYHCPRCPTTLLKRLAFVNHLDIHAFSEGQNLSAVQAPDAKKPAAVYFEGSKIELCDSDCPGTKESHFHCSLCGKECDQLASLTSHVWRCRRQASRKGSNLYYVSTAELFDASKMLSLLQPREVKGWMWHPTIVRNLSDVLLEHCTEADCCGQRFHCPLCTKDKLKPNHLCHIKQHLISHWRSSVHLRGYRILVCYLPCELQNSGDTVMFHFHCPVCGNICQGRHDFFSHLTACDPDGEVGLEVFGDGIERDDEERHEDDACTVQEIQSLGSPTSSSSHSVKEMILTRSLSADQAELQAAESLAEMDRIVAKSVSAEPPQADPNYCTVPQSLYQSICQADLISGPDRCSGSARVYQNCGGSEALTESTENLVNPHAINHSDHAEPFSSDTQNQAVNSPNHSKAFAGKTVIVSSKPASFSCDSGRHMSGNNANSGVLQSEQLAHLEKYTELSKHLLGIIGCRSLTVALDEANLNKTLTQGNVCKVLTTNDISHFDKTQTEEPQTVNSKTQPQTVNSDTQPQTANNFVFCGCLMSTANSDTQPQTVNSDAQPQTVNSDTQPQMVNSDTQPQTVKSDTQPQTVNSDAQPQTVNSDSQPQTVNSDAQLQTVNSDAQPQSVNSDTHPQTVNSETEPQLFNSSSFDVSFPSAQSAVSECIKSATDDVMDISFQKLTAEQNVSILSIERNSEGQLAGDVSVMQTAVKIQGAVQSMQKNGCDVVRLLDDDGGHNLDSTVTSVSSATPLLSVQPARQSEISLLLPPRPAAEFLAVPACPVPPASSPTAESKPALLPNRPRGRPKGSKNKAKLQKEGTRPSPVAAQQPIGSVRTTGEESKNSENSFRSEQHSDDSSAVSAGGMLGEVSTSLYSGRTRGKRINFAQLMMGEPSADDSDTELPKSLQTSSASPPGDTNVSDKNDLQRLSTQQATKRPRGRPRKHHIEKESGAASVNTEDTHEETNTDDTRNVTKDIQGLSEIDSTTSDGKDPLGKSTQVCFDLVAEQTEHTCQIASRCKNSHPQSATKTATLTSGFLVPKVATSVSGRKKRLKAVGDFAIIPSIVFDKKISSSAMVLNEDHEADVRGPSDSANHSKQIKSIVEGSQPSFEADKDIDGVGAKYKGEVTSHKNDNKQTQLEIMLKQDMTNCKESPNRPETRRSVHQKMVQAEKRTSSQTVQKCPDLTAQEGDLCLYNSSSLCPECKMNFTTFTELKCHLSQQHPDTASKTCDVCEKIYPNQGALNLHLERRHGPGYVDSIRESTIVCKTCSETFSSWASFRWHQRLMHPERKRRLRSRLTCAICRYVAADPWDMRHHREEHKNQRAVCPVCQKTLSSETALRVHTAAKHTNNRYPCQLCSKVFTHTRYLRDHLHRHRSEKRHVCPVCGWRFHQTNSLRAHMDTHKPQDQRRYPYRCPHCPAAYNNKSNYRDHLNKHTGAKPYVCNKCGRCFAFRSMLATHDAFVHSSERPHACNECDKKYKTRAQLQQHLVTHNISRTGTSPFVCTSCRRPLASKSRLRAHSSHCKGACSFQQVLWQQTPQAASCNSSLAMDVKPVGTLNLRQLLVGASPGLSPIILQQGINSDVTITLLPVDNADDTVAVKSVPVPQVSLPGDQNIYQQTRNEDGSITLIAIRSIQNLLGLSKSSAGDGDENSGNTASHSSANAIQNFDGTTEKSASDYLPFTTANRESLMQQAGNGSLQQFQQESNLTKDFNLAQPCEETATVSSGIHCPQENLIETDDIKQGSSQPQTIPNNLQLLGTLLASCKSQFSVKSDDQTQILNPPISFSVDSLNSQQIFFINSQCQTQTILISPDVIKQGIIVIEGADGQRNIFDLSSLHGQQDVLELQEQPNILQEQGQVNTLDLQDQNSSFNIQSQPGVDDQERQLGAFDVRGQQQILELSDQQRAFHIENLTMDGSSDFHKSATNLVASTDESKLKMEKATVSFLLNLAVPASLPGASQPGTEIMDMEDFAASSEDKIVAPLAETEDVLNAVPSSGPEGPAYNYMCSMCNQQFDSMEKAQEHIYANHGSSQRELNEAVNMDFD